MRLALNCQPFLLPDDYMTMPAEYNLQKMETLKGSPYNNWLNAVQ